MTETETPFIVVGVDGSDKSIKAMRWAIEHAKLLGARVRIIGAWDVPGTIYFTPGHVGSDYYQDASDSFDAAIAKGLEGLDVQGVLVEKELIQGRPSKALHDAAVGALSLVIGSHGLGSTFPGMHLGSTAFYCVNHAPCPVVLIRDSAT
jgi:nucleotide-binding universal stress UspA family protein